MHIKSSDKIHSRNFLQEIAPSLTPIITNVTKLALPILGMMALSHIPTVKAGVSEYVACVSDCRAMERYELLREFGLAACIASCAFYSIN